MVTADRTAPVLPGAPVGSGRRLWPVSTTVALLVVGALLALFSAVVVLAMPAMRWHPARDAELIATYRTYQETGVLLVKHVGEGSWQTQVPESGALAPAAWDDDPGVYILASLTSHITGSSSPYAGLSGLMIVLVAAPLFVLPLGVARLFRSPRAGYSLVLLPAVLWLTNHGTLLTGTEYGLADMTSPAPVYALYGIAASLLFLTLTAMFFLGTFRLRLGALVAVTIGVGLLGGLSNLCRSMSGFGPALAVGVLWLWHASGRARWWRAIAASAVAVAIAVVLPLGVMRVVDDDRAQAIGTTTADLPTAHALWHSAYLGLSYPEPITSRPSPFGITWSDEFGWAKAREIDPAVVVNSTEYNVIMRHLYADAVRAQPWTAIKTYLGKAAFTVQHFGAMIAIIVIGLGGASLRSRRRPRGLGAAAAITLPTAVLGLLPAVLVMPLLYYFSELSAALGLLVALAVGGIAWLAGTPRSGRAFAARVVPPAVDARDVSVVLAASVETAVLRRTLDALGGVLRERDEILVVADGRACRAGALVDDAAAWPHPCRLLLVPGDETADDLRDGVLASSGRRILLTAPHLPFGTRDLEQFRDLPSTTTVAIGCPDRQDSRDRSAAHPGHLQRVARKILLPPGVDATEGTLWVDGPWCRQLAALPRENGRAWTVDLVLAARRLHRDIVEIAFHRERGDDGGWPLEMPRRLRDLLRLALRNGDLEDGTAPSVAARPTRDDADLTPIAG